MKELPENPDIPPVYGKLFSEIVNPLGYQLDFSMQSLSKDFEKLFDDKTLINSQDKQVAGIETGFDIQTGLSCYLGEVLRIKYQGEWKGHCSPNAAANFYISHMMFGSYKFCPYIYVGYRIANGVEDTGNMENFLKHVIPSLEVRQDLKRKLADESIKQGKIFHNTDPWV